MQWGIIVDVWSPTELEAWFHFKPRRPASFCSLNPYFFTCTPICSYVRLFIILCLFQVFKIMQLFQYTCCYFIRLLLLRFFLVCNYVLIYFYLSRSKHFFLHPIVLDFRDSRWNLVVSPFFNLFHHIFSTSISVVPPNTWATTPWPKFIFNSIQLYPF